MNYGRIIITVTDEDTGESIQADAPQDEPLVSSVGTVIDRIRIEFAFDPPLAVIHHE